MEGSKIQVHPAETLGILTGQSYIPYTKYTIKIFRAVVFTQQALYSHKAGIFLSLNCALLLSCHST